MPILYRFEEDGSFVAGDTDTGFASRLAPTNRHTERAKEAAETVAFEMVEAERQHGSARQGDGPVNDAIRENDARFMAALKAGLQDGSTKTLAGQDHTPEPLNLIEYPSGRYGFVGKVPPELAFSSTHEGDIANAMQSGPDLARRMAERQGRTFGLLSWPTADAAQGAAHAAGYRAVYTPNPFVALADPAPGDDDLRKQLAAEPDHWGTPLSPLEKLERAERESGISFDGWEVSHVVEWRNIEFQGKLNYCEPLEATRYATIEAARLQDDYNSDFWTVYGHIPQGGVEAIEDFKTEDEARDFLAAVTGDRHADRTYPNHARALEVGLQAVEGPAIRQVGEGVGGQVIGWPEQSDTYHGQRQHRAEQGRPIEPSFRLLETLRAAAGEQGLTVANQAAQERGGLEPGERVFLAPRGPSRGRW